jgi:hypothetical protein
MDLTRLEKFTIMNNSLYMPLLFYKVENKILQHASRITRQNTFGKDPESSDLL